MAFESDFFYNSVEGMINIIAIDSGSGSIKVGLAHIDSNHNIHDFITDQIAIKFAKDLEEQTLISEILTTNQIQNTYDSNNKPKDLCQIFKPDFNNEGLIESIFKEKCSPEAYEYLKANYANKFSEAIKEKYISSIGEIVKKVHESNGKDTEVWLVGTAALRKADDGQILLNKLAEEISDHTTHTDFKIISQDDEGKYAFEGALMVTGVKAEDAIVWDIGGGSMQISYKVDEDFNILGNTCASSTFKTMLMQSLVDGKDKQLLSDNVFPLTSDMVKSSIELALEKITFPAEKEEAYFARKAEKHAIIIGAGNIHNSIFNSLKFLEIIDSGATSYSQHDLMKFIDILTNKTMEEATKFIPKESHNFIENILSNAILIYGGMNKYEIEEVKVASVSNVHALLYKATSK